MKGSKVRGEQFEILPFFVGFVTLTVAVPFVNYQLLRLEL